MDDEVYAVVTGASQGLGKQLAIELAKRGHNLILTSLPNEDLPNFAQYLANHFKIKTQYYETDLTDPNNIQKFTNWIKQNFKINILINNAGIGGSFSIFEIPRHKVHNIIMLNTYATTMITYDLLPLLKQQPQAYLLNIGSLAGFTPVPYKSVYSASKAAVYYLSRSLNEELKGSNICLCVAMPSTIPSNPDIIRRIQKNKLAKLSYISTEKYAKIIIKQMFRKKAVIIPGFPSKIISLFYRYAPGFIKRKVLKIIFKHDR